MAADANADNIPDGAAVRTTATDANGNYVFASLTPGKYMVAVTLPSGYQPGTTTATSANADNDDNTDNNGVYNVAGELFSNYITLITSNEPLNDGDNQNGNLTLDFGLQNSVYTYSRNVGGTANPGRLSSVGAISYKGFNLTGIYPNPYIDRVTISYTSEAAQKVAIRIADATGKTVYNTQSTVQVGKNNILISDLGHLAAGSYTVELRTGNAVFTKLLIR